MLLPLKMTLLQRLNEDNYRLLYNSITGSLTHILLFGLGMNLSSLGKCSARGVKCIIAF